MGSIQKELMDGASVDGCGEWRTFRSVIAPLSVPGILTAATFVFPWWNTDIGGFHGGNPESKDFRELIVRWFQYGVFSPVCRLHGDRAAYPADG